MDMTLPLAITILSIWSTANRKKMIATIVQMIRTVLRAAVFAGTRASAVEGE